jgi:hypothetical protein
MRSNTISSSTRTEEVAEKSWQSFSGSAVFLRLGSLFWRSRKAEAAVKDAEKVRLA